MAKVTAPLFGFSATGTIGKSVTFGSWKGVPYARQRVSPANPQTLAQQSTRSTFKALSDAYKALPAVVLNVFADAVQGRPLTARNKFIGDNTAALRGETDLAKFVASPGTRSAPAIGSVAAQPGPLSGEIAVSYGVPELPSGWTVTNARFVIVADADPAQVTQWAFALDTDISPTGEHLIEGLTPGETYAISAFLQFVRPDGLIAYSASRTLIATATA